ncbi:MAG: DUF2141 domain-containing protein [Bacteroidota bacterium]
MKTKFLIYTLLCLQFSSIADTLAQTNESPVRITFSNIRNNKGSLRLGIFKTQEEFESEQPFKRISIPKIELNNNNLTALINLPDGTYGISVLDDENNNTKMDYNMVRMPKEGFGFSNYYHTGFSKPKLNQFVFTVNKGSIQIHCKMRYI